MAPISRAALNTLLGNKVISGNNSTTAQNIRDFEAVEIDSMLNVIDDADVNGGYLKISASGIVNTSFIKKITPTGQFLKDDGTWASPTGVTASNGLTLTGSNIKLGGTLVNDTVINGASKNLFLGFTGSLLDNFSTVAATSTTITTANGALQSYFYGDSSYLVIGVDNSSSNTIEIFNAGSTVANNGTNNCLVISDGITSKGLVYALDYKANFTNESLVSKRYVDAAIVTATGFTSGSVIYSNGTALAQNNANFFWDNSNALLYIGANSGAYANTKLQVNASTNNFAQINFVNANAGASASSDYVATADTGTNTSNYLDLGINSSGFSDVTFTIVGAIGSYLYSNGGDMAIGTQSAKNLLFFTNGTLLANQRMLIDSTGNVNIGNASNTNQLLVRIGQQSSFIDFGADASNPNDAVLSMNQSANPGSLNYTIRASNTYTFLNAPQLLRLAIGGTDYIQMRGLVTTGASTTFTFTKPNNTGQTTNTAISGWIHNAGSRAWSSTATITNQFENVWNTATYTAGSASTITNAFGNYFYAPTASTNITITNNYAIGVNGGVRIAPFAAGQGLLIDGSVNTSTTANYIVVKNSVGTSILTLDNSSAKLSVYGGGGSAYPALSSLADQTAGLGMSINEVALVTNSVARFKVSSVSSVSAASFTFSPANVSTMIATVEANGLLFNSSTKQWATGNITNQRDWLINSTTYSAVGASVFANVFGLYINPPTAGTNVTFTNLWALGLNGSLKIESGFKLQLGNAATTGLTAGVLAATTNASIVLTDSTGQAYRIPCII